MIWFRVVLFGLIAINALHMRLGIHTYDLECIGNRVYCQQGDRNLPCETAGGELLVWDMTWRSGKVKPPKIGTRVDPRPSGRFAARISQPLATSNRMSLSGAHARNEQ